MRISDWSSDVCSSDLEEVGDSREDVEHQNGDDRGWLPVLDGGRHLGARLRQRQQHFRGRHPEQGVGQQECEKNLRDRYRKAGGEEGADRSEEHTSELQSLMRISYAVFCLKKKNTQERQSLIPRYKATSYSTYIRNKTHTTN